MRPGQLFVSTLSPRSTRGFLVAGGLRVPCALGRAGRRTAKREGDGATPVGSFSLERIYYRADRLMRPRSGLPVRRLAPDDGWCDAAGDRNYNRRVRHPYPASAERMWREDGLYDVVVVLSHNQHPRVQGRGSAVFLHVAAKGFSPTAGCVALRRADLVRLLAALGPASRIVIYP